MKVLLSAYACEPHKGSEPGVGWNWAREIARSHAVWVITRANNRKAIEEELSHRPIPNLRFCYVDLPRSLSCWKRGQHGIYLYYYLWQLCAYAAARRLHATLGFDLVHHLTFVMDWIPSLMYLLPVPLIWGPIGSHRPVPKAIRERLPFVSRWKDTSIFLIKKSFRKFDPLLKRCRDRAAWIIAINEDTVRELPEGIQRRTSIIPAAGTDRCEGVVRNVKEDKFLRVLSSGDLRYLKGFDLAVRAFAEYIKRGNNGILYIVGSGGEKKRLEILAKSCGSEGKVSFSEKLVRSEFLEMLKKMDVLLFPSFEGGGMVVLEAMARGKPIVCLDYGGPGEMITSDCGIKVPITSLEDVVRGLANALETLGCSAGLLCKMGAAAKKRVEDLYLWERKGETMSELYQEVVREWKKTNRCS